MSKILFLRLFSIAFAAMFAGGGGVAFAADEPCVEAKAECVKYIREAAERGDVLAQVHLGWMYNNGEGVKKDDGEAVRLYRLAAEQGHTEAQFILGGLFMVAEIYDEAILWLRLAAEQEKEGAQYLLGDMYYFGKGVEQDNREAVRWFRLAAEQGIAEAQYSLGTMYRKGEGVTTDNREAVRWYRLAAEQGLVNAQAVLGLMYFQGKGVVEDQREAYIWLLIAKANGEEESGKLLQKVSWRKYLTSAEIRSAKREAKRRFEDIENQENNEQSSDESSVQKGDGEFAVGKPPEQNDIAAEVFENTWRSVVVVKDSEGQGSGVIIRPNMVATNCHVIEGGNVVVYKPENRRINENVSFPAEVIHRNEKDDFCVLEVNGLWGIAATIRKYRTLKIGENVYALGAPRGLDLSLSNGLISQLRTDGDTRFIQTDAAISPGSSGGGLFDKEGNFIGILTSKYADEQTEGIGFAIPADLVLKF